MSKSISDESKLLSAEVDLSWFKSALKELRNLCGSESLSEDGLDNFFDEYKPLTTIDSHAVITNNNIRRGYGFFFKACMNENVNEGIIRHLLKYFPRAANNLSEKGHTPLQHACDNISVTLNIVTLLLEAAPDSIRNTTTQSGKTSLNLLCGNEGVGKATAVEILKLLLEKYPEATSMTDAKGRLPIHYACHNKNIGFNFVKQLLESAPRSVCQSTSGAEKTPLHYLCLNAGVDKATAIDILKLLLEKYPNAAYQRCENAVLPLHFACYQKPLAFCRALVGVHPEAVKQANVDGFYPIHFILRGLIQKKIEGRDAVDVVRYLLDCDPSVKLQTICGKSLLLWACKMGYDESNVEAGVQIINTIYDAHPDAIYFFDSDELNRMRMRIEVRTFIERELVFARQAKDIPCLEVSDESGQLPLHRALENNWTLGSIKLLVEGFPAAVGYADNNDALPVHVACQHHNSSCVAQYLININLASIQSVDNDGNTALHLACRSAKYETITMLLEKHDAVSLSKRNSDGKLPIDLLFESSEVGDRENAEYVGVLFRLLRAYPETLKLGL